MGIEKPIALTPGTGGFTISLQGLRAADIIVSTTRAGVSGIIRVGTISVVSHAALFCGASGDVIEAIGKGVVDHPLDEALEDDALAVAYRSPQMTDAIAKNIIKFASDQVGKPYTTFGAVMGSDRLFCRIVGPRPSSFFCSQLVIESYKQGGLPLTTAPSQCVLPGDIVEIATQRLQYVGHLRGNASWFPKFSP